MTNGHKSSIFEVNDGRPAARFAPSEPLCRSHIEKVASSVTFARAEQLRRLLRWLGQRSLMPGQGAPSEQEIAESVLNRTDFDPQADSLVRKEMSRLREKLSRYYQSEGVKDFITIVANNGYLFRFERGEKPDPANERSCWLVLPFRASREMGEFGMELLEELLITLSESPGPELVSPATALGYRDRTGDLRQFAAECHADFVVEGSLRRRGDEIEFILWLVDGLTGRTRRSRRINGSAAPQLALEAAAWLLDKEAGPLAMHAPVA